MSKLPAFQFYPADWMSNVKLRRCSHAARGAWMDVICILHDSDEYGVVRWPLSDLAQATNSPLKLLRELVEKGVLKGSDSGIKSDFIYTPRHGRKNGDPVSLIEATPEPIWYCARLVRDAYIRRVRGSESLYKRRTDPGEECGQSTSPNSAPKRAPKPPIGERQGDGSSSSSSSSIPPNPLLPAAGGTVARVLDQIKIPKCLDSEFGRSLVEAFAAVQGKHTRFDPVSFELTMQQLASYSPRKAMGLLSAWVQSGRFTPSYSVNWEEFAPPESQVAKTAPAVALDRKPKTPGVVK